MYEVYKDYDGYAPDYNPGLVVATMVLAQMAVDRLNMLPSHTECCSR